MQDNSSEENKPRSKAKGRKRCTRIDNSDSEEEKNKKNDSDEQENSSKRSIKEKNEESEEQYDSKNNKSNKELELQKKLKFIVNEVREKGKYEYNKQEIPENLKYHSDESDSSEISGMKKSNLTKKVDKNNNDNKENNDIENKNKNSYKRQISDRNSDRQSGKLKKSKKNKEGNSLSISSRKKSSNNNSDNKSKEITDFIEEDNIQKIKEEENDNDNDNIGYKKKENGNQNNNINNNNTSNNSGRKNLIRKKNSENSNNNDENNNYHKKSIDTAKARISHNNKYSADISTNNPNNIRNIGHNRRQRTNEKKITEKDEEEKENIKKEKLENNEEINEEKKEKNLKLKNLLENKKDILLKKSMGKEKKEKQKEIINENKEDKGKEEKKSYSKRRKYNNNKYKEEEIVESNSNEKDNNENNYNENFEIFQNKKKNNVRDIIERLKAKKNEREDLARQEKEAEEQSLMRGKNKQNNNNEEKNVEEDTEAEREAEKIRLKEKRMEERRLAREKRRKMEEEEKKRKEKEFEERKRKEEEEKEKEKEKEKKRIEEEKQRKLEEEKLRKKREKLKKEEENEIKKNKINEKVHLKEKSKSRKNSEKIEYGNNNYNNLPKKIYKDEEENDEGMENSNSNHRYTRGKQYKYSTGKKLNKEEEKRRKQLEKDLEDEINKNEISDENEKNKKNNLINIKNKEKKEIVINDIANTKLDRSFDAVNTYKKPVQKSLGNGKAKIYRPKRPGGVIRGRSHEKVEAHLLNKIDNSDQRITNENSNYVLTSMNSKKLNGNNFINSPNMAYSKKRSIGGIGGDNFVQLNKSFGEYRGPGIENGNNFMNGMYNINTLELSSLPDLNSSFDSRLQSFNSNNFQYGLNNDFYTRTAQKNYHNNTINSGNLPNNSNRFTSMNNFFGMNNMGNMSNINGLSYINGDNDNNFINMSNLNLNTNNNNSFFDLRQPQINPYDLNSSYNIGYNNPLTNYPNNQVNLSNLLSNNFLGLNNNLQRGISNYNPGNNFQNIFTKKSSSINIEDLLVLEEKLSEISIALNKTKIINNECFEFWNYYYNCSLYGSLEKLFTNVLDSNNVQISINYILMSLLICYDCSFDVEVLNNVYSVLKDLLNLNHKNLMLIYEHILSKISTESRDNIWVLKLLNIVNSSKNSDFNDYNIMNGYSMTLVEKINFNTGIIIQNIRVLLKNFKTPRVEYLTSLFKKINEKSYEDINNFFRQYILRVENINGSILASVFLKDNSEFKSEPAPYLHTINHKKYSLILDLDETLVHFKMNPENKSEGVLKVRPGVMEFLDAVDKYYELIIFTCATQDYANLLIDAIEENKIYFEHRLYRQHTVIIDNDFVKDLTRIGRPLDKIAIVDNMPQNFRLQKENGINIKAFWGEDIYDTALINLSPILINIAEEGGDIRKGLAKYRDEIVEKVTSNISKHNI